MRARQHVAPLKRFAPYEARALKSLGKRREFGAAPALWQTDPKALLALAASAKRSGMGRLGRLAYFRGFGLSPTADEAAAAVGSKVVSAGASAAATALGAGAAAGPIGLAAGAVVALALTLFQKNYFNVADANAACAQEEALWQKYLTVQGHVAGRALGWPTMQTLMHAATGAGLFPLNSQHLSFHEGTLQCAGNGAWVDSFLSNGLGGTSCNQHNCMADALAKFRTVTVPSGTADAVYFIDSIMLPMNAGDSIPWINSGASNPTVHQMLYDLADAYLAENGVSASAYVQYPATPTPATTSTPASTAPAQPAPAQSASAQSSAPAQPTMQSFPGFNNSISATDPRLTEAWTETESGYTTVWAPSGNGFFSTDYPQVTSRLQVAISGNSVKALRLDSNTDWASYQGTFDASGLNVSGTRTAYSAGGVSTSAWSASIVQAPVTNPAPVVSPVAAPVTTSPAPAGATMPAATMSETPQPTNITVTVPGSTPMNVAAAPPQTPDWMWPAVAGVAILGLFFFQSPRARRR